MDLRFAVTGRGNEAKRAREVVAQIGGVCVERDLEADVLVAVRGAGKKKIEDYEHRRGGHAHTAGSGCAPGSIMTLDMLESWQATGRRPLASLSSQQVMNVLGVSEAFDALKDPMSHPSPPSQQQQQPLQSSGGIVRRQPEDSYVAARHSFTLDCASDSSAAPSLPMSSVAIPRRAVHVPDDDLESTSAPLKRYRMENKQNRCTPLAEGHVDFARSSGRVSMQRRAVPLNTVPKFSVPTSAPRAETSENRENTNSSRSNGNGNGNISSTARFHKTAPPPEMKSSYSPSPPLSPTRCALVCPPGEPPCRCPTDTLQAQKREEALAAVSVTSGAPISGCNSRSESKGKSTAPDLASLLATYERTANMIAASKAPPSTGRMSGNDLQTTSSGGNVCGEMQTPSTSKTQATAAIGKRSRLRKRTSTPTKSDEDAPAATPVKADLPRPSSHLPDRVGGGGGAATPTPTPLSTMRVADNGSRVGRCKDASSATQRTSTGDADSRAPQWKPRLARKPMLPSAARRPVSRKPIGGGGGEKLGISGTNSEKSTARSKLLAAVRQSPYAAGLDDAACERVLHQIVDRTAPVSFNDIAGLDDCKRILQEALVLPVKCPQLFTGLRKPCSGLLLFGPPGNGKTLLAKAVARECETTFFSISAAAITSKWVGESETMVRALFAVARALAPSTIFIDEVDALLQTRGSGSEGEGSRRLKTEFLVQMDGAGNDTQEARVLVMGATNRPWDLDEAVVRRFPKRVLVPLPDAASRTAMLQQLLNRDETRNEFTARDWSHIASLTDGYSGNDIHQLCEEIAMAPVRELLSEALRTGVQTSTLDFSTSALRKISLRDVQDAAQQRKPSHTTEQLRLLREWQDKHGSR